MTSWRVQARELRATIIVAAVVLAAVGIALGVGVIARHSDHHGDVVVSEIEFKIAMPVSLRGGRHTFVVTNHGTEPHEFVVFRTGLRADALPRGAVVSQVDEASPMLHKVADSGSSLQPGTTRRITATLAAGHYVVLCNLPSHYGLGMRVDLTVAAA